MNYFDRDSICVIILIDENGNESLYGRDVYNNSDDAEKVIKELKKTLKKLKVDHLMSYDVRIMHIYNYDKHI